jgi:hypothetical protein
LWENKKEKDHYNNNNNNNNLFHVLIDPDTGIDTIQGYRMSHKFKTLVSIVIN